MDVFKTIIHQKMLANHLQGHFYIISQHTFPLTVIAQDNQPTHLHLVNITMNYFISQPSHYLPGLDIITPGLDASEFTHQRWEFPSRA